MMINAFLATARASNPTWKPVDWDVFMWRAIRPFVDTSFDEAIPDSLDRVLTLVSPYVLLEPWSLNKHMVTQWAATASAVQYTEEVSQSAVAVLLRIVCIDSLQSPIPIRG